MPKATLINREGKKVVVEVGSSEAQQYFGRGFSLMGAGGKPVSSPTPLYEKNKEYDPIDQASKRYVPAITSSQSEIQAPTSRISETPKLETGRHESLLISGPTELEKIFGVERQAGRKPESAIARTIGKDIYRRDLGLEQSKIGEYSKLYGQPKTDQDWRRFHNYAYVGTLPETKTAKEDTAITDTADMALIKDSGEAIEGEVVDTQTLYNPEDVKSVMEYAAKAGLTFDQTIGLLDRINAVSTTEKQQIRDDLGISDVVTKLFKQPDKTYQEIYDDAYQETGLPEVRERIKELNNQINQKRADLVEATGSINRNSWISEASRVGKLRVLNQTAEADINNLLAEKNQYLDLYDKGVDTIENMMQRYTSQLTLDRQLTAEQYNYLLGETERKIGALGAERQAQNLRYLPDYLKIAGENVFDKQVLDLKKRELEIEKLEQELFGEKDMPMTNDYKNWILSGQQGTFAEYLGRSKGLNPKVIAQVDAIVKGFDNHYIVKRFTDVQNKKLSVDQIIDMDVGGPGDLALVFEFMKALDPTSVVRESEYREAAKSGNIFLSWAERFNGYWKAEGGFMPDNVKKSFKQIINTKFNVSKLEYNNLFNEKVAKINMKTGDKDGSDYLTNYDLSKTRTFEDKTKQQAPQYDSLEEYYKENIDQQADIEQMIEENPDLTDKEMLEILNAGPGDFSQVGGDTEKIAEAIGQFESGGNYKAIGKETGKGRAYGKYQVMSFNIPSWTKEALGKSMTTKQFLNSPQAQDQVARHKIAQYFDRYGNIEDVASVWFSGRPLKKAGNAKDVLGTTVPQYVKNIRAIYNKLS